MNILQPWNLVFFGCFIVYFCIRNIFIKRTRGTERTLSYFGRTEKLLLLAMFPAVMLLPLLYLFSPFLNFANYTLPDVLQGGAAVVMSISLWLFWRSHSDLGRNWSVSIELSEDHKLVKEGVYRKIRHPMYASIWLWVLSQGLLLENWLAGWFAVPVFSAMYFYRIPREEGMMREAFGEDYENYERSTGRLLPRFSRSD